MAEMLRDDIDFSSYMEMTEPRSKVRAASAFDDELAEVLRPGRVESAPTMFSTKLRDRMHFRQGEVTAWAGYNGHKKSMFVGQVVLDLCAQNDRALIVSLEMAPKDSLARMARQAAGAAFPSAEWLLQFSRWTDGRLWLFDHFGRITPALCLAVLRYFADELKGTQVVVDSMMMVCASEERMDEQKQFTTDLERCAQETGLHVHLVTHCRKAQAGGEEKPPTKYDLRGSAAISDQCPNVVTVWSNKAKHAALQKNPNDESAASQPDMRISVEKQRNGSWEGAITAWFDNASMRFCDERSRVTNPYPLGPLALSAVNPKPENRAGVVPLVQPHATCALSEIGPSRACAPARRVAA